MDSAKICDPEEIESNPYPGGIDLSDFPPEAGQFVGGELLVPVTERSFCGEQIEARP